MGSDIWSTLLLFALAGGVLYFLMIRPQQKRQKEQQNRMSTLEPGARVMLISGIVATIKYLGDKQAVVEIAPGVEMTIDKRAISPQPVVDEFEYADEDGTEPADAEPAADEAPTAVPDAVYAERDAADTDPVATAPDAVDADALATPAEAADPTWDAPDAEKH